MATGRPPGANAGAAVGSIIINTTQAQQAVPAMQNVAQGINRAMGSVGTSVNQAQKSVNNFAGSFRGLGGAIGVGLGVQQIANFVTETNALAIAYDRQAVAARNLAGSQGELNELLEAYDAATGGAVDKATSLANVTKLMSVGFADSSDELEQFARVIRGISVAMGQSQDFVTQNLILELFTQRGMRLDQLGLQYDKVRQRADELAAADRTLTQQMAYQQAVLEQAEERFGALADSAEGQVKGLEDLAKAWKNFRLEVGQLSEGPVNFLGTAMANWLRQAAEDLKIVNDALIFMGQAIGLIDRNLNRFTANGTSPASGWGRRARGGPIDISESPEADDLRQDWSAGILELSQRTNQELADQHAEYQRERADTEREYQQSLSREAEDFARSRLRAEQDHAQSLNEIRADAMRREQDMAADLARTISRLQADSGDRIADLHEDHNKRIAELDEDFQREQRRREEDYKDDLLSAAGRLDAIKILELRKDRARELRDRKEAHDEQKRDLKEQLAERLDDENKALAKSIQQANEAHQEQLEEARENDARRLADMEADFALRKQREDEDRAERLERMAEDHQDQLAEMDRANRERVAQIARHAEDERKQLDLEHKKAMVELGVQNNAWLEELKRFEEERKKIYEEVWGIGGDGPTNTGIETGTGPRIPRYAQGGYVPRTGLAMLHAGETVIPANGGGMGGFGSGRSVIFSGDINIMGTTNMGRDELRAVLVEALEEIAGGS